MNFEIDWPPVYILFSETMPQIHRQFPIAIFRVDASRAGEGQLEISINDGDVPNAVQVLGGGKCLVTYTPEEAITHEIEVTFNDEQVPGEATGN